MDIRTLAFNSEEYKHLVHLRVTQLLEPIGVPAAYIDPQQEAGDIFIGAFENGTIIGCCVLTPGTKEMVQLRQMAVHETYRKKGTGAAIIAFAESVAKDKGFTLLMMHARDPVIDFYRKCGYEIAGDQFFEVGIGHHKMIKQLS